MGEEDLVEADRHNLQGTAVVVTGAGGGVGEALTRLLADRGAHVFAVDLPSKAESQGADPRITYRGFDASDEHAWSAFVDELEAELSGAKLQGLVNNAGITHRASISTIDIEDWNRVLGVNLTAPLLGIRALTPLMGPGSSIVNIGSSAALTGHYPVAYTTAKWALRGLTHVAATEFGPRGIRVNAVHPGYIRTPMTASAPASMAQAQIEMTPAERLGEPIEVAETVAFLLSGAASYISGAEIPVDGGYVSSGGAKVIADRIAQTPDR